MEEKDLVISNTNKLTRKQQAAHTKEKLLSVALKLIQEKGFDHVKITEICQEAGVSLIDRHANHALDDL